MDTPWVVAKWDPRMAFNARNQPVGKFNSHSDCLLAVTAVNWFATQKDMVNLIKESRSMPVNRTSD